MVQDISHAERRFDSFQDFIMHNPVNSCTSRFPIYHFLQAGEEGEGALGITETLKQWRLTWILIIHTLIILMKME